jgi:hypothetical protein
MAFFVFVLVLLTLEADTREALMVTPLWFVLLGAGWLFAGKRLAEIKNLRQRFLTLPATVRHKKGHPRWPMRLTMSRRLRAPFYLLSGEGHAEQHVIFEADVLHQVINQFVDAVVHAFQVVQASAGGVTFCVMCLITSSNSPASSCSFP